MAQDQLVTTPRDKSPLIEVIVWIAFAFSFLMATTRLATKSAILKKVLIDDYLLLGSLVSKLLLSVIWRLKANL
jgi:hypothetical protein